MLERARRKSGTIEWVQGDALALPFADGEFDAATVGFGVRNLADLEGGLRELARVLRPDGKLAVLEITRPRGLLRPFFRLWFDVLVPLAGKVLPGGKAYTYLPASVRRFPGPGGSVGAIRARRVRARALPAPRRRERRAPRRDEAVTALEVVRAAEGLDGYLGEVEEDLERAVAAYPGLVAEVGADALAAGGKRLRPALAFLSLLAGRDAPRRGRRGRRARSHGDARP